MDDEFTTTSSSYGTGRSFLKSRMCINTNLSSSSFCHRSTYRPRQMHMEHRSSPSCVRSRPQELF